MQRSAPAPKETKELRACLTCKLIKTRAQFEDGCDNCGPVDDEQITSHFKGMVAMIDKDKSWVNKWQRMRKEMVHGCYAISVPQATYDPGQDRDNRMDES